VIAKRVLYLLGLGTMTETESKPMMDWKQGQLVKVEAPNGAKGDG
jgi:hypothetical protein